MSGGDGTPPTPVVGVLEWFEVGERERVERVIEGLHELAVQHLRTGLSWAVWHEPGGVEWYDWLLPRLSAEFELLPCVTYTPPSLALAPRSSAPPRRPRDFADFIDAVITRYGQHFSYVELWNEPNNLADWDYTLDPQWDRFCTMIGDAAHWAQERGKRTVLGGLSPVDPGWLELLGARGVLAKLDVVGIHGFPGTWASSWAGWSENVRRIQEVLDRHGSTAEVWITEAGFSTWQHDELGQLRAFTDMLRAPVRRAYWYAAEDLQPERTAYDQFHGDEREYHFGLRRVDGRPKLLARRLAQGGMSAARQLLRLAEAGAAPPRAAKTAVITGGAGFVGANLAARLAEEGRDVVIFDNLTRPGEQNLRWLLENYGRRIRVEIADVRNQFALRRALIGAREVYHLAAQVAVTTGLDAPADDFAVNAGGTLTLLEEVRRIDDPPFLLFTSTNKVYGPLADLHLLRDGNRWQPADPAVRERGLAEERPLDFRTPYGCSKGAADQYVLDYAASYGLPTVVLRMSCIYGPRQQGDEDQGWVAHFARRVLEARPITLYGDGAQVRDILFIDDLVTAMLLARDTAGAVAGRAFNIGGGPSNAVSLLEVIDLLGALAGAPVDVRLAKERAGDQRYYVSDTSRFREATGWRPLVVPEEGIDRLCSWLACERSGRDVAIGTALIQ